MTENSNFFYGGQTPTMDPRNCC